LKQSFKDSSRKTENELLDVGIDIGDGKEEHIVVYEGDKAEEVVEKFCEKHHIDSKQKTLLTTQIKKAMEEELQNRSPSSIHAATQHIYTQTISENVDEDDASDSRINIASNMPVLGTRLPTNVSIGNGHGQPRPKQSEKRRYTVQPTTNLLNKLVTAAKPQSPIKMPMFQTPIKYPNTDIQNSKNPLGVYSPPLNLMAPELDESGELLEAESRYKRGNSVGDIGRCIRLYEQGLKKKAHLEKIAKEKQSERRAKEMEGVTFKPVINQKRKSVAEANSSSTKKSKKPEERLLEHIKVVQRKQEKIRDAEIKDYQQKHTFQPNINKKYFLYNSYKNRSAMLEKERSMSRGSLSDKKFNNPRFEQLFEDAQRRKLLEGKRQGMIPDAECTFSPNVELTHEFNSTELGKRKQILFSEERLYKKKKALQNSESNIDLKTGQQLYHPLIGRPPKNRSKSKGENIGDYLYAQKLKSKEIPDFSPNSESNTPRTMALVHDRSCKMVEKMRKECFEAIFRILDSDNDGIISAKENAVESLSKEVALIYIPLFNELEQMKCTLNIEEFVDSSNNLFKDLNVSQKNTLINFYKSLGGGSHTSRSFTTECHSFKPQISARSKKLAEKKAIPGVDLVTKLMQLQKLAEAKIEKLRAENENAKVAGCTFKPQLSTIKAGVFNENSNLTSPIRYYVEL